MKKLISSLLLILIISPTAPVLADEDSYGPIIGPATNTRRLTFDEYGRVCTFDGNGITKRENINGLVRGRYEENTKLLIYVRAETPNSVWFKVAAPRYIFGWVRGAWVCPIEQ